MKAVQSHPGRANPEPSRRVTSRHQPASGQARSAAEPFLYTAAEAAVILRVKTSWLERRAAARKIPFTMLGGSYRFTGDHLAAIVQMHEQLPDLDGGPRVRQARTNSSRNSGATVTGLNSALLLPRPSRRRSHGPNSDPAA